MKPQPTTKMAYLTKEKRDEIKTEIRNQFPSKNGWAFSFKSDSAGITVTILTAPISFAMASEEKRRRELTGRTVLHYNGYEFDRHTKTEHYYSEGAIPKLLEIVNNGNHDDSDSQRDYFDVGWYATIKLGEFNKPFQVKN